MALWTANFCIDAHDPISQAQWWDQVLEDFRVEELDPEEASLVGPGGRALIFLKVPEPKQVKNRMHMCLRATDDSSRDAEVDRLLGLGARIIDDRRGVDNWVVLADPEGNEFCVLNATVSNVGLH